MDNNADIWKVDLILIHPDGNTLFVVGRLLLFLRLKFDSSSLSKESIDPSSRGIN